MNLTLVLEPPHVCNTKKDFYGGKHDLEVDKMHFTSAWMTSPPDPLSAMGQSNSRQPNAERGKEVEKGWGKTIRSQWKQKDHSLETSNLRQVSTSFGGEPIKFAFNPALQFSSLIFIRFYFKGLNPQVFLRTWGCPRIYPAPFTEKNFLYKRK
jgi:hypothetical protein